MINKNSMNLRIMINCDVIKNFISQLKMKKLSIKEFYVSVSSRVIVEKENEKTISFLPTCKTFFRSEKWEENLFSSLKKSLILLILVDKNLIFFHVRREIQKNLFSSHMWEEKFFKKISFRIPFLSFSVTMVSRFKTFDDIILRTYSNHILLIKIVDQTNYVNLKISIVMISLRRTWWT